MLFEQRDYVFIRDLFRIDQPVETSFIPTRRKAAPKSML